MKKIRFQEGLTYDDVLLMPSFSKILPREANTQTRLTRRITINIPLISAAMDTVTESEMAIKMAICGGIGFIHKNMPIERQAEEVRRVKRYESGLILDPITLTKNATVGEAIKIITENKIGGIPILDKDGKLAGILTNRDLRFERSKSKHIEEVMTPLKNLIVAPPKTRLSEAEQILLKNKIEKLPLVDKNGRLKGLITFKDIMKTKNNPNSAKDKLGRLLVGAAVGVTHDVLERVRALAKSGVDVVCVDTAHGHSIGVLRAIRKIKKHFPELEIVGGNVATYEGALALIKAGVDAVKVGVGPGSICTTRVIAGIGVPQLTAVMEAARACRKRKVPVIADGGIVHTGDITKALAAGASSVMAGSIFAGVEESPGKTLIHEGRKYKQYRGMGSIEAMAQADSSKDRYFQDAEDDLKKLVPEGVAARVPYKGMLEEAIVQCMGGLRAGMGYCGAKNIEALQRKARFVKITSAGVRESHPHGVTIVNEAPNYTVK